MPKIPKGDWVAQVPGPHRVTGKDDGPYAKTALGDVIGLSQFGVHLEQLPPGSRSSHRHWHETEDEFVYIISGQLVLIEDDEILMQAGDAAGWKAGHATAHCFENRSDSDAVMLVVGTRHDQDIVHYPDHDLIYHRSKCGGEFTRANGSPIDTKD